MKSPQRSLTPTRRTHESTAEGLRCCLVLSEPPAAFRWPRLLFETSRHRCVSFPRENRLLGPPAQLRRCRFAQRMQERVTPAHLVMWKLCSCLLPSPSVFRRLTPAGPSFHHPALRSRSESPDKLAGHLRGQAACMAPPWLTRHRGTWRPSSRLRRRSLCT
jgi:hypothetical protein